MFGKLTMSAVQILLVGLALGAGLPAIFAMGIRAMAWGVGGDAEVSHERPHPLGKALAFLAFGIVVAAVAVGITIIVASGFGMSVSFNGIIPSLVKK